MHFFGCFWLAVHSPRVFFCFTGFFLIVAYPCSIVDLVLFVQSKNRIAAVFFRKIDLTFRSNLEMPQFLLTALGRSF